jgi:hypothetical protein
MTKLEKFERERAIEEFKKVFEEKYGHTPTFRITKSGMYLFDEGLPNQTFVNRCLIGRSTYFMRKGEE